MIFWEPIFLMLPAIIFGKNRKILKLGQDYPQVVHTNNLWKLSHLMTSSTYKIFNLKALLQQVILKSLIPIT